MRDLGKAMRIYETDCDTKIIEIVWDYVGAMLRLWYGIVWDDAETMVYGIVWDYAKTVVQCCWSCWVMIILGNKDNRLGKIKFITRRN